MKQLQQTNIMMSGVPSGNTLGRQLRVCRCYNIFGWDLGMAAQDPHMDDSMAFLEQWLEQHP